MHYVGYEGDELSLALEGGKPVAAISEIRTRGSN